MCTQNAIGFVRKAVAWLPRYTWARYAYIHVWAYTVYYSNGSNQFCMATESTCNFSLTLYIPPRSRFGARWRHAGRRFVRWMHYISSSAHRYTKPHDRATIKRNLIGINYIF